MTAFGQGLAESWLLVMFAFGCQDGIKVMSGFWGWNQVEILKVKFGQDLKAIIWSIRFLSKAVGTLEIDSIQGTFAFTPFLILNLDSGIFHSCTSSKKSWILEIARILGNYFAICLTNKIHFWSPWWAQKKRDYIIFAISIMNSWC